MAVRMPVDQRQGPEPVVVFLHGQPGTGSDWDAVQRRLPITLRRLAPDRPGYRINQRPAGSIFDNAEWLLGELESTQTVDVVLVGHSFGGGVALAAAASAGSVRVRGIVLVASVGPGCLDRVDQVLGAPVIGPAAAVLAWQLAPKAARARLALIQRMQHRALAPDEHVNLQVWGDARHDHGAMWRTFLVEQRGLSQDLSRLDLLLPRIASPCVILADPADRVVAFRTAVRLCDQLPSGQLRVVHDVGHHIPRRDPQAVTDAILDLIASGAVAHH